MILNLEIAKIVKHIVVKVRLVLFSQILKEEFEEVYKNFPILFIFGSLGFIKPVILLSNGFDSCSYLKIISAQYMKIAQMFVKLIH